MIVKELRKTGPGIIAVMLLIALMLWLRPLIEPPAPFPGTGNGEMPLYGFLNMLVVKIPFVGVFLSLLLVIFIAFLLINFNTSDFFITERTFLPGIIYVLLSGLIPQNQVFNPVLPSAIFLIMAIRKIMNTYKIQGTAFDFFDSGILISTGSLFYGGMIWLGLLIFTGIILLRPFNLKELLISLLGLITPWLILFGIYYVMGRDIEALAALIRDNLFGQLPDFSFSRINNLAVGVFLLIVIISLIHLISLINNKKIKARKTFFLLIWEFFISLTLYFILPSVSVEILWLVAIAASYFLTHYLVFSRNRIVPEIIFSLLCLMVILSQLITALQG